MLDTTDKIILRHLQADSKKTIKELAENLNMTTSPVFERIKGMEKEGVINITMVSDKTIRIVERTSSMGTAGS